MNVLDKTLRIIDIVDGTIVDGPGLRTSVYFAGCKHQCKGCHNPQSWDFYAGKDMTIAEIIEIIKENDFDVTLSGGDPLYQIDNMIALCEEIRKLGKTIWVYTGFTYEEICDDDRMSVILDYVDVIVDGPFVIALRDISLRFKGSSNQRLIDVKKSTKDNIVIWQD